MWSNWQAALTKVARQDGEIVSLLDAKRALENDCLIKDAAYDQLVDTADKLERRAIKAERANGALMIAAGLGYVAHRSTLGSPPFGVSCYVPETAASTPEQIASGDDDVKRLLKLPDER